MMTATLTTLAMGLFGGLAPAIRPSGSIQHRPLERYDLEQLA